MNDECQYLQSVDAGLSFLKQGRVNVALQGLRAGYRFVLMDKCLCLWCSVLLMLFVFVV